MKRKRFADMTHAEKLALMKTFRMEVTKLDAPKALEGGGVSKDFPGFKVADIRAGKHNEAGRPHQIDHLGGHLEVDTSSFATMTTLRSDSATRIGQSGRRRFLVSEGTAGRETR